MKPNKKVGIMGGTFNPIHIGHLFLAQDAMQECDLDEVVFMPSGCSYMKEQSCFVVEKQHRANMTKLAIADHPMFCFSDMELRREGPSYTCDTMIQLNKENPKVDYYFILGADSLFTIDSWKNPQEIFAGCHIVAASRGTKNRFEITERIAFLNQTFAARIHPLQERKIDISSSEIRQRIFAGKSVRYMIPLTVLEYIKEHHLYQILEGIDHEIS